MSSVRRSVSSVVRAARGAFAKDSGTPVVDLTHEAQRRSGAAKSGRLESEADSEFPSMPSFTDEEWRTLQFVPVWTFLLVAGADGEIDHKERAAYRDSVLRAIPGDSQLVLDVFSYHGLSIGELESDCRADPRRPVDGLAEAADLLGARVTPDDAVALKEAMLELGTRVAGASGPAVGSKVSGEEREALRLVSASLRLEG